MFLQGLSLCLFYDPPGSTFTLSSLYLFPHSRLTQHIHCNFISVFWGQSVDDFLLPGVPPLLSLKSEPIWADVVFLERCFIQPRVLRSDHPMIRFQCHDIAHFNSIIQSGKHCGWERIRGSVKQLLILCSLRVDGTRKGFWKLDESCTNGKPECNCCSSLA